jgi:penicillin-binding protein 2
MYIGKENRYVKCWKKQGGHGILDLMGAFMESCDVYYYNLALKLGVNNLFKYASGLGLNEKTGIDFQYEKKGTLPGIDWKKKKLRTNWYDGDTVNMGIGQGFMLTTPLQLADMLVNLINLGEIKTPHIVDNVVQNNVKFELSKGNPKPKIKLKKETTDFVFKSMFETVNSGTGKGTYIENLDVCGKTGTAQNPHGEDHAWFLGFAPYENPQVVVCVFIENGGGGGSIAAPIAKQVFLKCTELILKGKLKK